MVLLNMPRATPMQHNSYSMNEPAESTWNA